MDLGITGRWVAVISITSLAALVAASVSLAAGGASIKDAPTVVVGTQTFSSTANGLYASGNHYDFWKLNLIAGDHVVINFENSSHGVGVIQMDVDPAGTDDFTWGNINAAVSTNMNDNNHAQLVYDAPTTGVYPIYGEGVEYAWMALGAYDFTAYVSHRVKLTLPQSLGHGRLPVAVHYPDGQPVNDSALHLSGKLLYQGKSYPLSTTTASNGLATLAFPVRSALAHKQVRISVSASGSGYIGAAVTRSYRLNGRGD